jgi:transposase
MRRRLAKLTKAVRVVSIYETGYDGFWLHRALRAAGIDNRVIDAASVPVDRRARRVKTDRLALEQLIPMLLALERGETRACRVVRVPSPAEEDAERRHRERRVLAERAGHGNRISGLLMALGIGASIRADFVAPSADLATGDGEPQPPHTRQALPREHERAAPGRTSDPGDRDDPGGGDQSHCGNASSALRRRQLGRRLLQPPASRELFRADAQSLRRGNLRGDQGIGKAGDPRARTSPSSSLGCGSDTNPGAPRCTGSRTSRHRHRAHPPHRHRRLGTQVSATV